MIDRLTKEHFHILESKYNVNEDQLWDIVEADGEELRLLLAGLASDEESDPLIEDIVNEICDCFYDPDDEEQSVE